MIEFKTFTLENNLKVIFHKDPSTPMTVVNTLYDVGARDEDENKTGFAHLFEHLMFGGSANIPDFDGPLQQAGGESNAFTSNDITNYYDTLPAHNLETALWLESDRMLNLAFTPKSLEVQRQVVIEEFKQRYLNQPYGDAWLEFRPLAYKNHPYKWATIGKEIAHIEDATMQDVKDFFTKFYNPSNAILCVAGNFEEAYVQDMVNKWYRDIPSGIKIPRTLPKEPTQLEYREKVITRKVPADAFYYGFKMPGKIDTLYYTADLLSDVLGRGKSSRLYSKVQKELNLVSDISAYVLGAHDEGLLMISGKLNKGVSFEQLDDAIWGVVEKVKAAPIEELELIKIKNKVETTAVFSDQGILNKSMSLCAHELLGDANNINLEQGIYDKITAADIHEYAKDRLTKENCSVLKIKASTK
ncbi:MAG: M16 family metallopeptidase [Lishizhenia sp.]